MATADTLLLWDPDGPALIAATIVGRIPWSDGVEQQRVVGGSNQTAT
jgi:hypothetical protein